MKALCFTILIIFFIKCTNRYVDVSKSGVKDISQTHRIPDILAIDTKYPLSLKEINLHDSSHLVALNEGITSQIQQTIIDYYVNECAGDDSESNFKLKDTYIATIRLFDSQETIFMVLLNHIPSGQLTSKVLFYDNITKAFEGKTLDFNIHALYNLENGELKPSNLKTVLNITAPEIDLVDLDKTGHHAYKFTRLYHNGTSNILETTIVSISDMKIDTLEYKNEMIKSGE
ncbi:MAG: hypothetical protein IPP15_00645 [Saprospiraceae bacterium]|uniref:Uncharacterized protein n=1 Tax=Candidatus Opimibacter skivensis TaxID=2982028 RepID=A0A9D7SPY6_9BACT|nr:hypothetical protein [Candidatus Opimibacter skivensis]